MNGIGILQKIGPILPTDRQLVPSTQNHGFIWLYGSEKMRTNDVAFVQPCEQQITHSYAAVQDRFQLGERMEHRLFRAIDEVHSAKAVLGFGEEDLPDIHYLMTSCRLEYNEQTGAGFHGVHRGHIRSNLMGDKLRQQLASGRIKACCLPLTPFRYSRFYSDFYSGFVRSGCSAN